MKKDICYTIVMDGLFIRRFINEAAPLLEGGMVQKIHVAMDTLFLRVYGFAGTRWLVLCAMPGKAHPALLTSMPVTPRKVPTAFCMGLRKFLENSRIVRLEQVELDRVIRIVFNRGSFLEARLYGLQPDIRLFSSSNSDQEGSARNPEVETTGPLIFSKVAFSAKAVRPERAHFSKQTPLSEEETAASKNHTSPPKASESELTESFLLSGLGRRESEWLRSQGAHIDEAFLVRLLQSEPPCTGWERLDEKPLWLGLTPCLRPLTFKKHNSAVECSAIYSEHFLKAELILQTRSDISAALKEASKRLKKKIQARKKDLQKAGDPDILRRSGDNLAASLHLVKKGNTEITIPDLYNGGSAVIALNPALSPSDNLNRLYNRAGKAKRAHLKIGELIKDSECRLEELNGLEQKIKEPSLTIEQLERYQDEIQRISGSRRPSRRNFAGQGHKTRRNAKGAVRPRDKAASRPDIEVYTVDGWVIMVGRSAQANDRLTIKTAKPDDLFFHVADAPGGHVILRTEGKNPPEEVIEKTAAIAAWFSSVGHGQARIPVMVAYRRDIKKPPGAAPGSVTVGQGRSVRVIPRSPAGFAEENLQ